MALIIASTYLAIPLLGLIWLANLRENQNSRRLLRESITFHNLRR